MDNSKNKNNAVLLSLLLNTLLTIVEIVIGVISGSLALVADGARNLTDSILLAVSFIAERLSKPRADKLRTWGYGRVKIIASLLNTGIILTIALTIGFEAIRRFNQPNTVHGTTVILVAALSVFVNALAAFLLKRYREDLNIRTAFTGLKFGAISSVGVLLAGVLIALFNWSWVDSVTGIVIAALLLFATINLAREAVHILLEGVPASVNIAKLEKALREIPRVVGIKELHAWTLEQNSLAFSCQLILEPSGQSQSREVVDEAKQILKQQYGFTHMTIEVDTI